MRNEVWVGQGDEAQVGAIGAHISHQIGAQIIGAHTGPEREVKRARTHLHHVEIVALGKGTDRGLERARTHLHHVEVLALVLLDRVAQLQHVDAHRQRVERRAHLRGEVCNKVREVR